MIEGVKLRSQQTCCVGCCASSRIEAPVVIGWRSVEVDVRAPNGELLFQGGRWLCASCVAFYDDTRELEKKRRV